jgi:hypothetical protein
LKALKDRAVQKQVVFNRNISPSLCSIRPPKLMLPRLPRHRDRPKKVCVGARQVVASRLHIQKTGRREFWLWKRQCT